MDIVINAVGMPFNGETVQSKSLGGSESAAYYLARGMAARGNRVTVFTTTDQEGEWDGVTYVNAGNISNEAPLGDRFTFYALNTPHDVLIAQRHPLAFHKDWASKINIWQLHDLALHRAAGMVQGGLPRIDFTTAVSEFHARQVSEVYGIPRNAIRVVPNGVDLALYAPARAPQFFGPEAAAQFKLLYQSRPERGLEHLVRPGGIMDQLRSTPAHLYVCGYDNTTAQMAPFYDQLYAWAAALPNVTLLGALPKPRLADLQRSCDLLCYPTEFEEVSCITAMEAMAAHLPMLTSHHAALPETCEGSGTLLLPLRDGRADEDAFVRTIGDLIADLQDNEREGASRLGRLKAAQIVAAERVTWERAADTLLRVITEQFRARASSPARVLRHCIEHSDISFLDWYRDEHLLDRPLDAIAGNALEERARMFEFLDSPAATLAHYEKFEGINCDRIAEAGIDVSAEITNVATSSRFRGIAQMLADVVRERPGEELRVLEFGCAHGHITMALARAFPELQFTGMDFMGRSVGLAVKRAGELGVSNVTFMRGSLEEVAALDEQFDVVIAAEVIEHIYDYRGAMNTLRQAVATDGTMIFTTPTGRWEWSGHEPFRRGREHVHHFERGDWLDILRDHPTHALIFAPFAPEESGCARGSWIVSVRPGDKPFCAIDYARKFSVLAPRETVSAGLIVKNAEHTIGKALSTIVIWVDEVVIALDPTSNDETARQIELARVRYPWTPIRVIPGMEALRDGFGPARNRTLETTCGDWFLWMDADEEVPQAHNIWRMLRPSAFNGYGCPQIHYSAQPAQVLTTDYPCRLFRRGRGVQFYGLVHEHPEDQPGKSIAHVTIASDIQFLHNGYVDETTRRARYQRNLPLLLRDIEVNPARTLNKFLLLRDLAQGIGFERAAGIGDPGRQLQQAQHGVALMHEMIAREDVPLRMVLDSLQYYSICNELLGVGFVVKLNWAAAKPPFDTMNTSGSMEARVHDRATYFKLLQRIAEESTRNYEARYV